MTDAPQQLDYAPPVAWHRRKSLHKWLVLLACLATVASSYWWAPPAWRHAQVLYWQRQCMNYTADPNQVVWHSDGSAAVVPEAWTEFDAAIPNAGFNTSGTLFLGRMTDPSEGSRLVAVHVTSLVGLGAATGDADSPPVIWLLTYSMMTYEPGSLLRRPVRTATIASQRLEFRHDLRFYAGQIDPEDPSHFSIAYDLDGERHVLDGWLRDNTMMLEQRPEWINPAGTP